MDATHPDNMWDPSFPNKPRLSRIQHALKVYRQGKCGLPFSSLAHFALPLIDHYELSIGALLHENISDSNLEGMEILVDVLESTHLLICFLALQPAEQHSSYDALRNALLGTAPEPEEEQHFNKLLQTFRSVWDDLGDEKKSFDMIFLAQHFSVTPEAMDPVHPVHESSAMKDQFFGPDRLELPEAFALFGRPLLDDIMIEGDLDLIEEYSHRIELYWNLALAPKDQFEQELEHIISQIASKDAERVAIREEAHTMVKRFKLLFPDKTPPSASK